MSRAVLASFMISFMMYLSLAEIRKQEKLSSFLEEIESNTD
jgi:hypothetical protein